MQLLPRDLRHTVHLHPSCHRDSYAAGHWQTASGPISTHWTFYYGCQKRLTRVTGIGGRRNGRHPLVSDSICSSCWQEPIAARVQGEREMMSLEMTSAAAAGLAGVYVLRD